MKDALKRAKNKNWYARIAVVNMALNKNVSVDTVANGFCVSRGTVYAWLAAYDRNGLDGLADDTRSGCSPPSRAARPAGEDSRRRQAVHRLGVRRVGREEDRREIQRTARAPFDEVAGLRGQEDPPASRPRPAEGGGRDLAEGMPNGRL